MIKLKILRACAINGIHHEAGKPVELEDAVAHDLISMGKAARLESNRAIGLKTSDGPKLKSHKQ